MSAEALAQRVVAPLDVARRTILRFAFSLPPLHAILIRRDRRVALWAIAHAIVAFALVAAYPMLLFVLGPVLLGVAHVAADIRYLVLRRRLPRLWLTWVWVGCIALICVRLLEETRFFGESIMRTEQLLATGWVGLALWAGARSSGNARRALAAVPLLAALAYACWAHPLSVRLAFVHCHNLIAIGVWLLLFRNRLRSALLPLAVIAGLAAILFSTATYQVAEASGGLSSFDLHLLTVTDWIAPGLQPEHAVGLTLTYVFLQSVHYSTGLLLVPQEDVAGQGTTTFRMSMRDLFRDFGTIGVALIAVLALSVVIGAFWNVHRTRGLYLNLAMFHGYLELCLLAYFWATGFRPARTPSPQRA